MKTQTGTLIAASWVCCWPQRRVHDAILFTLVANNDPKTLRVTLSLGIGLVVLMAVSAWLLVSDATLTASLNHVLKTSRIPASAIRRGAIYAVIHTDTQRRTAGY